MSVLDLRQGQPRLRLQEALEVHVAGLHQDVDPAPLAIDLRVHDLDHVVVPAQLLEQRHLVLERLQLLRAVRGDALQRKRLARRALHQVDLGATAATDRLHLAVRHAVDVDGLPSLGLRLRTRRRLPDGELGQGVRRELVPYYYYYYYY